MTHFSIIPAPPGKAFSSSVVKESLTTETRREVELLSAEDEDVKALESLAKEINAVKLVSQQNKTANDTGEEVGG